MAQQEFPATAAERTAVADCLERTSTEPALKQMSNCRVVAATPCLDAQDVTTFSLVACHMREQKIWDGCLNDW